MRVEVKAIVSQEDFGTIFNGAVKHAPDLQIGTAIQVKTQERFCLGWPAVGEVWEVKGCIKDHPQWGKQVRATSAHRITPTGKLIKSFLEAHAPGVGPERADALWKHFGFDLATILSDEANIPEIASVIAPDRRNLAPLLAAACVGAWREAEAETDVYVWLAKQDIEDVGTARRIAKILGTDAVKRLCDNPYCLVPLLPWRKVDALALKLFAKSSIKNPSHDTRRLIGACDAVVKDHIAEGHTAGTLQSLTKGLVNRLKVDENSPLILEAREAGKKHGAFIPVTNQWWRAPGCAAMEDQVFQGLREIAGSVSPIQIPDEKTLEQLLRGIKVNGYSLVQDQREAIIKVLLSPLSCLQGGAGVGKTTTTKIICDQWVECGGNVILTAIAGKAAQRLGRSAKRPAMTLARLRIQLEKREKIGHKLEEQRATSERRKLFRQLDALASIADTTMVVVDEASMLDLTSATALLRLMPKGARLLLVGDEAQLPPVGFGLIYHRLVADDTITARLKKIHRQDEASVIPHVAAAIRAGVMPTLSKYSGRGVGVSMIECSPSELREVIQRVWNEFNDKMPPLVLAATNDDDVGIHALNSAFHRSQLHGKDELKGFLGQRFAVGDPVTYLKNDYSKGLFNGLLGTIVGVDLENRSVEALFEGYDEPHQLEGEELLDLLLAYAITCHRAQGSQAPVVIVQIHKSRLLEPSWLYTAVTRAELQVVLVGSKEVLAQALASPGAAYRRMVGFQWKSEATC